MPKLLLITLLSVGLSARIAHGADTHFNVTDNGIAIGGYDVVVYFASGKPQRGVGGHSFTWSGAEWHFVNNEHRTLFAASPETYAPSYGGWCSMGMAGGRVVEVDFETAWVVSGKKLYFNVNQDIHRRWLRSQRRLVGRADERWPSARDAILADDVEIARKSDMPSWYNE